MTTVEVEEASPHWFPPRGCSKRKRDKPHPEASVGWLRAAFLVPFLVGLGAAALWAQAPMLQGRVLGPKHAPMEGVVVTATRAGSNIAVSVDSGVDGRFAFPAGSLTPGNYQFHIRAEGYDLVGHPQASAGAARATGSPARLVLQLAAARDEAAQLTGSEWLQSVPGTSSQKQALFHCVACHSITPIVESTYSAASWMATLVRMRNWAGESVRSSPVKLPFQEDIQPDPQLAAYLASINRGPDSKWNYRTAHLRTNPRPSGAATQAIITEYSLTPGSLPHDAIVDYRPGPDRGDIWYNDFQRDVIGRLDPRTGVYREWKLPPLKPGFPPGQLSLKFGLDGNLWIPRFRKAGITRFDPQTEKFTTWAIPKVYNNARADTSHVSPCGPDGLVWFPDTENRVMYRLNPATGHIDVFQLFPGYHPAHTVDVYGHHTAPVGHRSYGTACDAQGNVYFADIAGGNIGEINAQTGKSTLYKTPTLESGPRRMSMDAEGHVWFGENYASKLGMFDTHTHRFQEWTPPIPWSGPYPAMRDKLGNVWTGGMSTDFVYRLDPKTSQWTAYLLPTRNAEIRWITVDSSTTPVTIWIPEVHRGKIARLQVLPQ